MLIFVKIDIWKKSHFLPKILHKNIGSKKVFTISQNPYVLRQIIKKTRFFKSFK